MIWRGPLCFADPQLEREFTRGFRDTRRKGTLLLMVTTALFYVFNFVLSDGINRISDPHLASQVLYFGQVAAFSVIVVVAAATWRCRLDLEAATMIYLTVVSLSLFTGNTFRVSYVFGGDLYESYIANCDAAVCYDDTLLLVALAGITSVTIIFAALRVAKSWILVILTTLLYFLGSSFGLGPVRETDTVKIGMAYALLICLIWYRSFTHERELRRQWVDNRHLRLEVERQAQRCEEQQRWLDEVTERLDAMQLKITPPAARANPMSVVDIAKYMVPGHDDLVVQELHPYITASTEPNALLSQHMAGRRVDLQLVKHIASRIRDADYGMRQYFEDCIFAFPELELFNLVDQTAQGSSSGRDGHTEYQRTFGALFAVYWLLRLGTDGKLGLSFGCDEAWRIRQAAEGDDDDRKTKFFNGMQWDLLQQVADEALGGSLERVEAMLCLTAIHDIMKMSALVPCLCRVHAPYNSYGAGDSINDHDQALAYVLEYFPHLLPSFACLPGHLRDIVLFTQTKMSFNHGWFVQAEGPPGAMLSSLKRVLKGASGANLAFYFVHWLTDLSGAEGTPLAGAEKLTRKFPLGVLVSFLWSMPFLQRLAEHSETEVVEDYLEARFRESFPDEPFPNGDGVVATLRLAVMAQKGAGLVVEAFRDAPSLVRNVLSEEMALTGVEGQTFASSPAAGGPAFLVYYGPALLQRCNSPQEMQEALFTLACVYAAGRQLWPKERGRSSDIVTLEVGQLVSAHATCCALDGFAPIDSRVWALVRQNEREARLELLAATNINGLVRRGAAFVCVDLRSGAEADTKELEDLMCTVASGLR